MNKAWELFKAHEEGLILQSLDRDVHPEDLPTSEIIKSIFHCPSQWKIIKPKKKVKLCAFISVTGLLYHSKENSADYKANVNALSYVRRPEFDIEKEVIE